MEGISTLQRYLAAFSRGKKESPDIDGLRRQFPAIRSGRIVTNNAASTQIPEELLRLQKDLALTYENVHRGQSAASVETTALFENAYKVIANFIGAPDWNSVIIYRGTTEAINAVMYSLMTEFRDGDNVVTTYLEHNSNYVPWYGLAREILPRFGVHIECRLAKFDVATGELDLDHLASLIDNRTKIVCCTGASNFLGTKPPLDRIRELAQGSGYLQPNGIKRSYLLIDGAQLLPNAFIDVVASDIDFLAWSFHKIMAPVGAGGLYARKEILETLLPFQYGGDMIAPGKVNPDRVEYNVLPWKYTAGTPNIMGTILSGEATEFLVESVLGVRDGRNHKRIHAPDSRDDVRKAMKQVESCEQKLSGYLIEELLKIDGLALYGPKEPSRRTALVSFNLGDKDPIKVAEELAKRGIEARAGCHCAGLAHNLLDIYPRGSCRISPYIYNTMDEMRTVVDAVKDIARRN